jgi:hypothetical protein
MNAETIIADMEKAVDFFGEMLNFKLTIEIYPAENRFEVVDAGVDVMIDLDYDKSDDGEERIFLSTVHTIPGCMYMPNGDPGYPPEADYIDQGVFDFSEKDKAIERMLGLIATSLVQQRADAAAEAKYFEQLEEEQRAANAGEPWFFNY